MSSAKLDYARPTFSGTQGQLFSSFFSLIENEILKQVSWQVATEQPNKVSSEIASEASLRNYINHPLSEQPRACSDVLSDVLSGEGHISYCNQVLWLCHPQQSSCSSEFDCRSFVKLALSSLFTMSCEKACVFL